MIGSWEFWNDIDRVKIFEILPEKFKIKNIKIDIKDFEQRKDYYKNAWMNSLKHQLKELPDFDEVFSAVLKELEEVERISLRIGPWGIILEKEAEWGGNAGEGKMKIRKYYGFRGRGMTVQ